MKNHTFYKTPGNLTSQIVQDILENDVKLVLSSRSRRRISRVLILSGAYLRFTGQCVML